jgi:uncharacterized membrane protein
MSWADYWWISWGLIVLTRVWAISMRFNVPTLRGDDTFFGFKVAPDFYASGPGRALMRSYRLGLIGPPVCEAILIGPVIYWGRVGWILATVMATSFALMLLGRWNARRIIRAGKKYAIVTAQPAATVSMQLETRSPKRYRSVLMELLIWILDAAALLLIVDSVRVAAGLATVSLPNVISFLLRVSGLMKGEASPSGAWLFWPLMLAYIQFGAMLMKYAILAWPMRMSAEANEEIRAYREDSRRYLVRVCDWTRLVFAMTLIFLTVQARFPELTQGPNWHRFADIFYLGMVALILGWYHVNARRLMTRAKSLKTTVQGFACSGAGKPDPSRFRLGGLAYFDPDSPSVLIPSRAGWALNFADRRAYISLAYLSGLLILAIAHLRFGW